MKICGVILALALCCSCAHYQPDPWTKDQKMLQAASLTLNTIDWGQTLDIENHQGYYETNPILGKHPSRGNINTYFVGFMITEVLITHLLPTKARNWWLGLQMGVSINCIRNNYSLGLKLNY